LGILRIEADPKTYQGSALSWFKPGLGGRIGVNISIAGPFAIQASLDAIGIVQGTRVILARDYVLVDQPPILMGATVTAVGEF